MALPLLFWVVPAASVVALLVALYFYRALLRTSEGTPTMAAIAGHVRAGAAAYLRQQYRVVGLVFLGLTALFAVMAYVFHVQNPWVPFAFITGGLFSGLAGWLGMKTATAASARTAHAARTSLDGALRLAFRSGAVMGLVVVGLGLLDISLWFLILSAAYPESSAAPGESLALITTTMLTFGMGASTQALFARVGGGIFTKAADVGADLVGKVEAGIPEDDPRNPATIADNVGDNVGDVAGMGADLYESYCGAVLATAALGAAAFRADPALQLAAVIAAMAIAALGTLVSIAGIFAVRTREGASQSELLRALGRGVDLASVLVLAGSLGVVHALGLPNPWGLWGAIAIGLAAGVIIGKVTEHYTSHGHAPTRSIAASAKTGPATVLITGLGVGMVSTAIPVLTIAAATLGAYLAAAGGDPAAIEVGLYGVGIAAVGMLSTLGITLATDAYGPIADNAGGNAEMSCLPPEVRARTDALDALGNTTAATGKGYAMGSAALTALALIAAYFEEIKVGLLHAGASVLTLVDGRTLPLAAATPADMATYFDVNAMNPSFLAGILVGSVMAFVFSGLAMLAVGRAAGHMVDEVRRQFRESPGILAGTAMPDYALCVAIATRGAQREMLVPALLAIATPVAVSLVLGVAGVVGLLIGGMGTGFVLAVFMSNTGGAWDNAKKYIEEGHLGGKGGKAHKAAVIGDTVGDPFKDTAGPSLNILIKLMSMVAIVMAGLTAALH